MDIATATQLRDAALTAYLAAINALSVSDGDKSVRYQEIDRLRAELERWEQVVARLEQPSSARRPLAAIARWTR